MNHAEPSERPLYSRRANSLPSTFQVATAGGLAALVILTGCAVGPDYKPPAIPSPTGWSQSTTNAIEGVTTDLRQWWTNFNDPLLERLIERAATNNLDLRIASARIREAQAARSIAKSGLAPQVDGTGAAQLTRASEETTSIPRGVSPEDEFFSIGASASWELDVWGRVRRSIESATASYEATIEDFRDTQVILYGEVASVFIEARTLQRRIQSAERNAKIQEETLQLTKDLNEAGLVGDLDVSQATLNVERTRSTIPTFRAQLVQTINLLGVLLGQPPQALHPEFRELQPIPVPPDAVGVGLPANLLRQRPDLRRSERNLAAQTARIGVATAELYPQFSLPGTLALEALDIGNLDGSSLTYAFGPTFRWTLFSAGRVRNTIKAEEALTEQFLHSYEQTVLLALKDTEDAMVAFAQERDRNVTVAAARAAAQRSVDLVKELYRSGLTQFQDVLDMERSLAQEDDNLAVSRGLLAGNAVRIYRALGGGWNPDDPEPWGALETAQTASRE